MADYVGETSSQRIKGISLTKPIVYGNLAKYFGKKREGDGHTHEWTVFLKPFRNEDMTVYVKKVHFKLHDSYNTPTRVLTKPPYEVRESGWGEFDVAIKIFFVDPNEKPVTIYHLLRLFQSETDIMLGKKTLVKEVYDEIVFQDPTALMHQLLTSTVRLPNTGINRFETNFEEKKERQLRAVVAGKERVRHEINELSERLRQNKSAIRRFTEEIAKLDSAEDERAERADNYS